MGTFLIFCIVHPLHPGGPIVAPVDSQRLATHLRRRSVGFLQREGRSWACFLVTYQSGDGGWKGYFSFRPEDGEWQDDDIRTATIFLEASEGEINRKARGLGRPLLLGLLASALHSRWSKSGDKPPQLRRWFRKLLAENVRQGTPLEEDASREANELTLHHLESLYESYRTDQVAHFIALLRPEDFSQAVDRILEGQRVDFSSRDQLQLAMLVVEHIETLLPLPPFPVWAEDFMAHRETYHLYAHTLHRTGRLP
ncbi:MAG: hypothetical protein WEA09_00960 [Gemmatimonadota bacterium]